MRLPGSVPEGREPGLRTAPRSRVKSEPSGSLFHGIALRLLLLLLLAAVPAAVVLAFNIRQVLQERREEAIYEARLRAHESALRHRATVELAEQLLQAAALNPAVLQSSPEQCDAALAALLKTQGDRTTNIWVMEPDGMLRCSGQPASRATQYDQLPWFRLTLQKQALTVGPVMVGVVSGIPVMTVALPILNDGRVEEILATGVPLAYLRRREREDSAMGPLDVWLVDAAGEIFQVAGAGPGALPPAADLKAFLSGDTERVERLQARDGDDRVYARASAGPEISILIASSPSTLDATAQAAALRTFLGFALFVGTALLVVGLGGRALIVRPLTLLSREVGAWRPGARFEPALPRFAPAEVLSLARSFAAATTLLARRDSDLQLALTRCELLVAEVHHRVRNNLQIISSLLNLQANRLRDPQSRAEFLAARNRIRAMATLYRHLETTTDRDVVRLRSFLDEMTVQLFDALGELPGSRIVLTLDAPDLEMTAEQAVPFAMIVTELLTNALKYAFPPDRRGRIEVQVKVEGTLVHLRVEDDGVGFAEGLAEPGVAGLGMRLIEGFARQLGATIERSGGAGGTKFELRFRLRRSEAQTALLVP